MSDMEPYWDTALATQKDIGARCGFRPTEPSDLPPTKPGPEPDRTLRPLLKRARVLLADAHFLILDMLRDLIEPEFKVVGAVSDGQWLIDAVNRLQPDIVLSDIMMPVMSGLDAGKTIRQRHARTKVVYITAEPDLALVAEAFSFGAWGFLLKQCRSSELLHALRTVRDGGIYLTPLIAGGDISAVRNQIRPDPISSLSAREVEVVSLLVRGQPMKEVARRLGITARTVAFHKYNVMSVLGLRGNADLVKFAMEHRILR